MLTLVSDAPQGDTDCPHAVPLGADDAGDGGAMPSRPRVGLDGGIDVPAFGLSVEDEVPAGVVVAGEVGVIRLDPSVVDADVAAGAAVLVPDRLDVAERR